MMPVMDGFDVLENLKQGRESNYFPIIVLSALTDKQSIVKALSMGADDYVTKAVLCRGTQSPRRQHAETEGAG